METYGPKPENSEALEALKRETLNCNCMGLGLRA